jgi:NADH-ubiquinone oxidoreductase chain 4
MINLIILVLISLVFLSTVLMISSNTHIPMKEVETNILKHVTYLEEKNYIVPYVLRKYYSQILSLDFKSFPNLFLTSFWYDNMFWYKEKESKFKTEYVNNTLKKTGLYLSLILFILIAIFWFKHKRTTINYQMLTNEDVRNELWNIDVTLAIDGVSLPFILLVGFILPIVYLSNWSTIESLNVYYVMIIILLELSLIIVFLVIDLIMFYVFFESILPPLFVLIGLYGASQKFRAGYYLFLYTLFGSLFMLLSFVKVGGDTASSFFEGYGTNSIFQMLQEIIWIVLFVSFSVKTPLVPVHIWLPLAHSDANVSGSIILASIVLKLALYGFIRILIGIFAFATTGLTPFFIGLCSLSVLYSSFTTIRQFDLKVLVAYSSIAHMASSLLGTFSDTIYGIVGSIIFGLAHGFISPGLFILVGAILYDRCGSRIMNYYRGLSNLLPFFALFFLLFVFGNMGVPLTANFIGEFLSLLGAYQQNIFIASIGALSVILSAVYSIFMYNRVTGGSLSPYIHTIPDIFRKEFAIIFPLIAATILIGIIPFFVTDDIEFALSNFLLWNIWQVILKYDIKQLEEKPKKLHQEVNNSDNGLVILHKNENNIENIPVIQDKNDNDQYLSDKINDNNLDLFDSYPTFISSLSDNDLMHLDTLSYDIMIEESTSSNLDESKGNIIFYKNKDKGVSKDEIVGVSRSRRNDNSNQLSHGEITDSDGYEGDDEVDGVIYDDSELINENNPSNNINNSTSNENNTTNLNETNINSIDENNNNNNNNNMNLNEENVVNSNLNENNNENLESQSQENISNPSHSQVPSSSINSSQFISNQPNQTYSEDDSNLNPEPSSSRHPTRLRSWHYDTTDVTSETDSEDDIFIRGSILKRDKKNMNNHNKCEIESLDELNKNKDNNHDNDFDFNFDSNSFNFFEGDLKYFDQEIILSISIFLNYFEKLISSIPNILTLNIAGFYFICVVISLFSFSILLYNIYFIYIKIKHSLKQYPHFWLFSIKYLYSILWKNINKKR